MDLLNLLFLLACFVPGCRSFTWNDKLVDGQVFRACAGSDVTFGWVYTLGAQETVTSTEWLFQGHSQEIVAMFSHGTFVVLPTFSQRVQQATNGGFTLSHVTKGDAGNFSVEINGHDASGASMTERKMIVLIVEDMMTSDNPLQVTKSPQPVHDDVSDRYTMELLCGNFSFVDQPPFDVQWTLPSGLVVNSSSYHDNQFHLLVPTPFEGGRYRCQIPSQATPLLCLPVGHASPHADVTLDGPLTRLMLMEAEQTSLRQHNHQMAHLVQQLDVNNQQLNATIQQLSTENQQLKADNRQLKADNKQLKEDNTRIKAYNQQLKEDNQHLKVDYQQLNTSYTLLRLNVLMLSSENYKLKSDFQQQAIKVQQLVTSQQQDHATLTSLTSDLQHLNSTTCGANECQSLRASQQQDQATLTSLTSDLQGQINRHQADNVTLRLLVQNLQNEMQQLQFSAHAGAGGSLNSLLLHATKQQNLTMNERVVFDSNPTHSQQFDPSTNEFVAPTNSVYNIVFVIVSGSPPSDIKIQLHDGTKLSTNDYMGIYCEHDRLQTTLCGQSYWVYLKQGEQVRVVFGGIGSVHINEAYLVVHALF